MVVTVAVAVVACAAAVVAETEVVAAADVVCFERWKRESANNDTNMMQADSVAVTEVDVAVVPEVAAHPEAVVVTVAAVVVAAVLLAQRAVLRLSSYVAINQL